MAKDEHYIIDLCDRVLNRRATRQRRFSFLRGDPGKSGRCATLPVDAYYDELKVAIEYQESQHTEPNALFDRKPTVSGCHRGEQRRRYDQRKMTILREHGIRVVVLDYRSFEHDNRGRLKRNEARDEATIRNQLLEFLND